MWLKWLCLVIIAEGVLGAENFLSHLYGMKGQNKVVVCLKPVADHRARECTGALVYKMLACVRAGCVRIHPLDRIIVLRLTDNETCDDVDHEYSSYRTRGVHTLYFHPWADLVLVQLSRPYYNLDLHPNSTIWTASRAFEAYGIWTWIKQYITLNVKQQDKDEYYKFVQSHMLSNTSPLLLFFLTIFLPLVLLILVFFYVIYCTGNQEEIPYKNLQYEY